MSRTHPPDPSNPFALVATNGFRVAKTDVRHRHRSAATRAAISAAKYLLLVVLLFSALIITRNLGNRWLLGQLTADFHALPIDQQQQRLVQIAGFGQPAIPHLVDAMVSDDVGVARTAHEILRGLQNQWSVQSVKSNYQCHNELVNSIVQIVSRLPEDRTGWATSLLQQSILESVEQADENQRMLYQNANRALATLSHDGHGDLHPLNDDGDQTVAQNVSTVPRRLTPKTRLLSLQRPLPVDQTDAGTGWTDWPATAPNTSVAASQSHDTESPLPTLYRPESSDQAEVAGTSIELKRIMTDDAISLKPIPTVPGDPAKSDIVGTRGDQAPGELIRQANAELPMSVDLVETALQAYDDRSVMTWLSSNRPLYRDAAKLELLSRGYDANQVHQAQQLSDPDPAVRLHFVQQVIRSEQLDPRPWLHLMSTDEDRRVRMAVVAALGSLSGHDAVKELKRMMEVERDPSVAAKIRHTLDLGTQGIR